MADVWVTRCRRRALCRHCNEPVMAGEPILKVKFWSAKKHSYTAYFHPPCWLEKAMQALEAAEQPQPRIRRGRAPLGLTPEEHKIRAKVIWNHANLTRRVKKAAMRGESVPTFDLEHQILCLEIQKVGGVPSTW